MMPVDVAGPLAEVANSASPQLFTMAVVGLFGWFVYHSAMMWSVRQSLKVIERTMATVPAIAAELADHRADDAAAFARVDERLNGLRDAMYRGGGPFAAGL